MGNGNVNLSFLGNFMDHFLLGITSLLFKGYIFQLLSFYCNIFLLAKFCNVFWILQKLQLSSFWEKKNSRLKFYYRCIAFGFGNSHKTYPISFSSSKGHFTKCKKSMVFNKYLLNTMVKFLKIKPKMIFTLMDKGFMIRWKLLLLSWFYARIHS